MHVRVDQARSVPRPYGFPPLKELISRERVTAACVFGLPFLFPLFTSRPIVLGYNELRSSA